MGVVVAAELDWACSGVSQSVPSDDEPLVTAVTYTHVNTRYTLHHRHNTDNKDRLTAVRIIKCSYKVSPTMKPMALCPVRQSVLLDKSQL